MDAKGSLIVYGFDKQLEEVRNLDTDRTFKQQLHKLEREYKFIVLRSLTSFHKEMHRANMHEKLQHIKEQLCDDTKQPPGAPPYPCLNTALIVCRHCGGMMEARQFSNELCCVQCGLLEPLDGVTHESELVRKPERKNYTRRYNFRRYLDKHLAICAKQGYTLEPKLVQQAKESFTLIEDQLPPRISMPFVANRILCDIVTEGQHHWIVNYFWLQVSQASVQANQLKWETMLRSFDAHA